MAGAALDDDIVQVEGWWKRKKKKREEEEEREKNRGREGKRRESTVSGMDIPIKQLLGSDKIRDPTRGAEPLEG